MAGTSYYSTYYWSALVLLFLLLVGLYLVLSGQGEFFNIGDFLIATDPYMWASLGVSLCIALSVVGAAWGIFIIGSSVMGGAVHAPRIKTKNLISVILCEAAAIYGIIISIVMSSRLKPFLDGSKPYPSITYFDGYSLFWAGIAVGACNLLCGLSIGVIGSAAALADASDSRLFVKILVIEIFASAFGLFGLIVGLLESGKAIDFPSQ